jgi:dihydroxy-acid dehydratase
VNQLPKSVGAGNPHATFCGNRGRATASGDPVDVTILDSYEAVGAVLTGAMDEATLARLEHSCLPTVGACAGQFTANTMAMVSEALGLSVPNVSMIPGPYAERAGFAWRAGAIVMRAVANDGPLPRDIVTRKA